VDRKNKHDDLRGTGWTRIAPLPALTALYGCEGVQSTLDPRGRAAELIAQSHWIMLAGAILILVLVTAMALYAVYRDPERRVTVSPKALLLGGGLVFPVVVLSALLVYGLSLMGELRAPHGTESALELRVVARQWSWQVHYPEKTAGHAIVLENELRIPAGRPVRLNLVSEDVIHSFWVPSLAGKMDVIPGHRRQITIQADRPGRLRGQCAEFCGREHAHMSLLVLVEPAEAFDAWLAGTSEAPSGHDDSPRSTASRMDR